MKRNGFLASILLVVASFWCGCGGSETVQFGAVLPLSGAYEIYGNPIRKGIELAVEQIQADTSFPYPIEIMVVDSGGDPDTAAEQAKELFGAGAIALIGGVTTDEALKMVPIADRFGRIMVSPSASTPQLTGISKYFYRVFPSDSREGTTMGTFAAGKLGIKDIVILAKEDAYALGIQEVFSAQFVRNNGTVTEIIEYPPGAADFSGFIDRVLTINPSAVYVAAYANDVAEMIGELRGRGFEGTIMTTSAFASPAVIERVGEPAEGVFLTQAVFEIDSEKELIQSFVAAYRDKHGLPPDLYAAHGYDSMMVLAETLKKSGTIPKEFWQSIRGLRDFDGVTGKIQFDERGDVQKFPRVYVVEKGNLKDYNREFERRRQELLERLRRLNERKSRGKASG